MPGIRSPQNCFPYQSWAVLVSFWGSGQVEWLEVLCLEMMVSGLRLWVELGLQDHSEGSCPSNTSVAAFVVINPAYL